MVCAPSAAPRVGELQEVQGLRAVWGPSSLEVRNTVQVEGAGAEEALPGRRFGRVEVPARFKGDFSGVFRFSRSRV